MVGIFMTENAPNNEKKIESTHWYNHLIDDSVKWYHYLLSAIAVIVIYNKIGSPEEEVIYPKSTSSYST